MNWNDLAREVHQTAVANGLWDKPRTFDDIICECLVHPGRAYEEYRSGRPNYYHLCQPSGEEEHPCEWDLQKPCPLSTGELACEHRDRQPHGAAAELGKCVLRLLDFAAQMGLDVEVVSVYADADFSSFSCSVSWQLVCIHQAVNVSNNLVKGHINHVINLVLSWAAREGLDLESILQGLHECEKARAGRRGGTEP